MCKWCISKKWYRIVHDKQIFFYILKNGEILHLKLLYWQNLVLLKPSESLTSNREKYPSISRTPTHLTEILQATTSNSYIRFTQTQITWNEQRFWLKQQPASMIYNITSNLVITFSQRNDFDNFRYYFCYIKHHSSEIKPHKINSFTASWNNEVYHRCSLYVYICDLHFA